MDRTKFFNVVTVNGISELDFLDNTLINFQITRPTLYYRVREVDLHAPDLISFKAYGQEQYWWVICLVNNVLDTGEDLFIGQVLMIPDILDIYDFAKRWRVR